MNCATPRWSAAAGMDRTFESFSHEILFSRIKISYWNDSPGYALKSTWRDCVENNRNYIAIIPAYGMMRIIGSRPRFTKAVNVTNATEKINIHVYIKWKETRNINRGGPDNLATFSLNYLDEKLIILLQLYKFYSSFTRILLDRHARMV